MTELLVLYTLLSLAFVLAPLATNEFFLGGSKGYSIAHAGALSLLALNLWIQSGALVFAWPLFCLLGLALHIRKNYARLISARGAATILPFVFSLISATWFVAAYNDLQLLGYGKTFSLYAALHGSYLGWLFVACLAFLSTKSVSKIYLFGCFAVLICFLLIAYGIDGVPYIKRIGAVGLTLIAPGLIGAYAFATRESNGAAPWLAKMSLVALIFSMLVALLNEFWLELPRVMFGLPTLVLIHGLLNALVAIPCFYFAVRLESRSSA